MSNFIRNCPICNNIISYKKKHTMLSAIKKNSECKSCSRKGEKNPMHGKFGELNPFFNKHHTKETKQKIVMNKDYSSYKTDEFREKMRILALGQNNNMFGKSVYDVWVEKYGVEIANVKLEQFKLKQSKNSSGKNNPMFGKPSPVGSGNGWSGWYKGWFFRSIKELSYMINVIEKYNIGWCSAESNELQINYIDYSGDIRTYNADFILNKKYLVEIKPKKLWNSDSVRRKKNSAIKFCKENGLIYKLRDTPNITTERITELFISKQIIFIKRYEDKFIKKYFI